jgi:Lon protease-like protein
MTLGPKEQERVFKLPLFPLSIVLYPGMMLPLHIFEERYQAMIGDCARDKKPFGIVLLEDGKENEGSADPIDIGTTARILDVQELGDGRKNILTRGDRRFKIHKITQTTPYMIAEVSHLPDEVDASAESLMKEMQEKYKRLLACMASISGTPEGDMHVPSEPAALSFTIAAKLATRVQLPAALRQEWLECDSVHRRMVKIGALLDKANTLLEADIAKSRAEDKYLN